MPATDACVCGRVIGLRYNAYELPTEEPGYHLEWNALCEVYFHCLRWCALVNSLAVGWQALLYRGDNPSVSIKDV